MWGVEAGQPRFLALALSSCVSKSLCFFICSELNFHSSHRAGVRIKEAQTGEAMYRIMRDTYHDA